MRVSLSRDSRSAPRWFDASWRRRVARAASAVRPVRAEVNVVITDDAAIRRLNRRYRGKDKATDVLSFSYLGENDARDVAGDVVVSHQTLARDARRLGVEPRDLALRIVVHGLLHVAGYDHEDDRDARRMERRERRVLTGVLPARVLRDLFADEP